MFTLRTLGIISTWTGVETVSRNSAFASPPAFATAHLYEPASSDVTASMARIGPKSRTRELLSTGRGSLEPLSVYQLQSKAEDIGQIVIYVACADLVCYLVVCGFLSGWIGKW